MIKLKKTPGKKYSKDEITGSYNFTHIQFNFSFLTTNSDYNFKNKKIDKKIKADILDRLCELSSMDLITIHSQTKQRGFEYIDANMISINASCHPSFFKSEYINKNCPDKYCIFRLYPNNNPFPARIIGKLINGAFYIHFFTLDHKCYT